MYRVSKLWHKYKTENVNQSLRARNLWIEPTACGTCVVNFDAWVPWLRETTLSFLARSASWYNHQFLLSCLRFSWTHAPHRPRRQFLRPRPTPGHQPAIPRPRQQPQDQDSNPKTKTKTAIPRLRPRQQPQDQDTKCQYEDQNSKSSNSHKGAHHSTL